MTELTQKKNENELTIIRTFNVSRELVWKAWTEPEQVMRWWGPKSFTTPVSKIDLRVGGKYIYCMRSPEGKDFWGTGIFREIVAPERLVMTDSFADENGNVVPATYYGMSPDFPQELLIRVTFEELEGGRTRLTLTYSGIKSMNTADKEGMQHGWIESFDKLAEYLVKA